MKTILLSVLITGFPLSGIAFAQQEADQVDGEKKFEDPVSEVVAAPDGKAYFPKDKEGYYTKYYRAAKLPSMQFKREEKGKVRFRLAILPSFGKPLFLTYMRNADEVAIEIKRLRMSVAKGELEPVDIELSGMVVVGGLIARNLEQSVLEPSVRRPFGEITEIQRQAYQGLDGCIWILEVSTDSDYTMEEIWSPETIASIEPEIREKFNLPKVDMIEFIRFRDYLLEISDMQASGYPVSNLLEND